MSPKNTRSSVVTPTMTASAALLSAISMISPTKETVQDSVSKLEMASDFIKKTMFGAFDKKDLGPIKTAFTQKIEQIEDCGVKNFTALSAASWVTSTLDVLDAHIAKSTNGAGDQPHQQKPSTGQHAGGGH